MNVTRTKGFIAPRARYTALLEKFILSMDARRRTMTAASTAMTVTATKILGIVLPAQIARIVIIARHVPHSRDPTVVRSAANGHSKVARIRAQRVG
jgi:hypothetical protein